MKQVFCLVFMGLALSSPAQKNIEHFDVEVSKVRGDLNKDNVMDYAIVMQDTLQDKAPYRLQVFFGQPEGESIRIVTTDKAIPPQFPNGRKNHFWGNGFDELEIKNGVLWIKMGLIRGHYEYKFRYQNGHFELIGYTYVNSDGLGMLYFEDFNLSTGVRLEKKEPYGLSEEKGSTTTETIRIRPLPGLETFEQHTQAFY